MNELVQKWVEKLRNEVLELRQYYQNLLDETEKSELTTEIIATYQMNLFKLQYVEAVFCRPEFYYISSNDFWIISKDYIELLLMRELNTAYDLMESVYLTSDFQHTRKFEYHLMTVLEWGLLCDKRKEEEK